MKKTKLALAALLAVSAVPSFAQSAAPASDWTVTGNAGVYSDYRFRGFTQTNYGPAFQGGFDIAHSSGFYVGNWNSNVSSSLMNGASLEMDFYGGFKGEITSGLTYDVGAIYYYYPRSGKDVGGIAGSVGGLKVDNKELYVGLGYGPVSAKLYYALGDYFKIAGLLNLPRKTDGTTYLDLSYSQEFGGFILGAHYGLLTVKNHDQFTQTADVGGALPKSVGDYKLSIGKDIGGFVFTAAVVGTSKKGYFGTDLSALKAAGKTRAVLSVSKTF
jgi:uncharacterized protein (TIGR02001 family)